MPLNCDCYILQLVAVRILIKHGASVDIKDSLGFTPLFLATGM